MASDFICVQVMRIKRALRGERTEISDCLKVLVLSVSLSLHLAGMAAGCRPVPSLCMVSSIWALKQNEFFKFKSQALYTNAFHVKKN